MTPPSRFSSANVRGAFERAARVATRCTPADWVGLVRRDGDHRHWVAGDGVEPGAPVSVCDASIIATSAPRIETYGTEARLFRETGAEDVQSAASVPLGPDGEAVLIVTSAAGAFDEADLDALVDLGGLIAAAVPSVDARHYEFLENVPVGVYRSTPDGRLLYANPPLADLFGADSVEELKDVDLNDAGIAQDDRAAFKEMLEREGEIVQNETVWTRADGDEVHVLESARVVRGEDGTVRYYEGVVEDITERKRAEQALRAEKDFIDSALDSLPGAFYLVDRDGHFRRWNQQL